MRQDKDKYKEIPGSIKKVNFNYLTPDKES